jgi:hypothetical protein
VSNIVVLSAEQNAERKYCTRQSAARYLDCDPGTFAKWVDLLELSVFYDPMGRPRYLWKEVEGLVSVNRPKTAAGAVKEFRPRELLAKARAARGVNKATVPA